LAILFIFGEPNNDGLYSLNGTPFFIPLIFSLIMTVRLESRLGVTVGNSTVGLKGIPMIRQNRKLTLRQPYKRYLLDPIDMFFWIPTVITINNTEKIKELIIYGPKQ
jgi:hypothetical protein